MTESALVQRPTFPASVKLVSSTSKGFWSFSETVKRFPVTVTPRLFQVFPGTLRSGIGVSTAGEEESSWFSLRMEVSFYRYGGCGQARYCPDQRRRIPAGGQTELSSRLSTHHSQDDSPWCVEKRNVPYSGYQERQPLTSPLCGMKREFCSCFWNRRRTRLCISRTRTRTTTSTTLLGISRQLEAERQPCLNKTRATGQDAT
jgi:hypothetical protein